MKTVIFNGSPRKNGDTVTLVRQLAQALKGECSWVNAVDSGISPCVDCRACWKKPGCVRQDAMQEVYAQVRQADCIVIASPVYFSQLTGSLLNIMSRFQCVYTARRFLGEELFDKPKKGVIVLAGGGDGHPAEAENTAKLFLKLCGAKWMGTISSLNTDQVPAGQDEAARCAIKALAQKIINE